MKFSGQTKDGAIDNLLRAYVSRPSNPHQVCPDFDPDQANAYVERSLPSTVRMQYESHLSACAACRKSVVELMRMAEADSLTAARHVSQSTWLSGLKQMFGSLSQPQWAMAATAVIILAVSLPLFLTRNQALETSQTVANQSTGDNPVSAASPATHIPGPKSEEAQAVIASSKQRENSDDTTPTLVKNAPASAAPGEAAAAFAAGADLAKKPDGNTAAEALEGAQRKAEVEVAPAQAGAAPGSQVGRSDADQNRQPQTEKDSAQQVSEPKIAARANEEGAKDKTERAEVVAAPPPTPTERGRSSFRQPGKLALRDPNTTEAVRPEERRFSGKKFLFKDGAWTDKDFNPNKDLPVVTIIRDSNVYNEVLTKRPGLKPFLTGFQATERAIIVYKGTVYKLIPQ
jgi:hypothetical protein